MRYTHNGPGSHGSRDGRIHALFTFALWFATVGYIFSSLGAYIEPLDSGTAIFAGAIIVSSSIFALKFVAEIAAIAISAALIQIFIGWVGFHAAWPILLCILIVLVVIIAAMRK